MNRLFYTCCAFFVTVCLVTTALPAYAGSLPGSHYFSLGARMHREQTEFDNSTFGDDDLEYIAAYEYHEKYGYWQVAVGYTPELELDPTVGYVLTPEINLIFKDRYYRAGAGVLKDYVEWEDGSGWKDLYYQLIVGLGFSLSSSFALDIDGYYVFDELDNFKDFDLGSLEFAALIRFGF